MKGFTIQKASAPVGRRCILNVAVGTWHPKGQERLGESIVRLDGTSDRVFWNDVYPEGSPTHQERPCAFKTFALKWAREAGYEQALWLDASMIIMKQMEPVWKEIEDKGHLFVMDGTSVGAWLSDRALLGMGRKRDDVWNIPLIFAGCLGLDFKSKKSSEFLDKWSVAVADNRINYVTKERRNIGGIHSADPRCEGHCGEQSFASVLRFEMGFEATPYGKYMALRNYAVQHGSFIAGAGM